jgi:ABC-2 type transport system ATP-binding protein
MVKTNITDMANRHCSKLSKGYKQRVGLAQALIHDPEVLVLDEPTAGLDPKQIIEVRDLIRALAGDHTVVLSTHILPEVSQTCQRVVIINRGRVVAVDTPDNLTRQLKGSATLYVQVDAAGADAAPALSALSGVRQVSEHDRHEQLVGFEIAADMDRDIRRDVARLVVDKGWGLLSSRLPARNCAAFLPRPWGGWSWACSPCSSATSSWRTSPTSLSRACRRSRAADRSM